MSFNFDYPIFRDELNLDEVEDFAVSGDAAALTANLVGMQLLILGFFAEGVTPETREEVSAQVAAALEGYVFAVENAAVTDWVRCCAATAVPLMSSIVGAGGFNPGQIAEFAAGVKTLTTAFQESLTPA
jgi:hypothetical protein